MKTTSQKNSFGGGFGINRNVSGDRALTTAEPAMSNCTRNPGRANPSSVGKTGNRHFAGAKIMSGKK